MHIDDEKKYCPQLFHNISEMTEGPLYRSGKIAGVFLNTGAATHFRNIQFKGMKNNKQR